MESEAKRNSSSELGDDDGSEGELFLFFKVIFVRKRRIEMMR